MDAFSPDQYLDVPPAERSEQAFSLLRSRFAGTLAMATGGCARYAFCTDTDYCLDRRGYPLIKYTSPNPHHHLILNNTTMTLRLPHAVDAEGNEQSILILTGMLSLVDPGDHDSFDRHLRYYQSDVANYSRSESRLYRLIPDGACFELFSGKRLELDLSTVIRRNVLSAREEERLLGHLADMASSGSDKKAVGIDGLGVDFQVYGHLAHHPFESVLTDREEIRLASTLILAGQQAS